MLLHNAHGLDGRCGQYRGAELAEGAFHRLRYLLVFEGHQARQVLYDGHLNAQCGVEPGQLATNGTRADDNHRRGQLVEQQGLLRGEDALAINGHKGHFARTRTRGEDDMFGLVLHPLHFDRVGCYDATKALNKVDGVLLQEELDALRHRLGYGARTLHDGRQIGRHRTLQLKTVLCSLEAVAIDLRTLQQGLRRNTAPIQADTARLGLLHEGDLLTELGSPNGGYITARAATDDQNIVLHYLTTLRISPLSFATVRFQCSV